VCAEKLKKTELLPDLGLNPQDKKALMDEYGEGLEAALRADPYLALLRPTSINLTIKCVGVDVDAGVGVGVRVRVCMCV